MKRYSDSIEDVIVLEFNELCSHFIDQFIDQGKLPHFKRLRDTSVAMITDADEAPPRLEPWIQWVTIHSGLKAEEHKVFDLGEGRSLETACIAKLISDQGIPVGILGSMNTNYQGLNGFLVPDPWDLEGKAEPKSLQPFYQAVAKQVQDSSTGTGLSKRDLLSFGWFMIRHGMKPATIKAGIVQLLSELKDKGVDWRRSMILEKLQFDLFLHLKQKFQTRFSTFFCNSTAHFQHYYWRNMEPEIFAFPPGEHDHLSLQHAILEGYQQMDHLVGRFSVAFPKSRLILITALSQKPWRETTKCTFRPKNFEQFLQFVGISPRSVRVKPVMAEEFHLICNSSEQSQEVFDKIIQATIQGEPVMKTRLEEGRIFCGCAINDYSATEAMVTHPVGGEVAFGTMFHMVHSMRSGRHDSHGLFWVQSESPRVVSEPIPLNCVAPTLLDLFNIASPGHMSGSAIRLNIATLESA